MNYGLYTSASGLVTSLYKQDVLANNLANVHTNGFHPDVPSITERQPEAIEGGFSDFRNRLLDKLGGGVLAGPQQISLAPGNIETTGNSLDVALTGRNSFLAVQTQNPTTGQSQIRLTRDGRFLVNPQGVLVTAADGHPVLGPGDQPIQLHPNQPVTINTRGQILQAGAVVGELQVTGVRHPEQLAKVGQNLIRWTGQRDPRIAPDDPGMKPGAIENSAVDPIKALTQLMSVGHAITDNATLIHYQDQLMDKAVNVLGQVA